MTTLKSILPWCLSLATAASLPCSAQNIPPFIGGPGKPNVRIADPFEADRRGESYATSTALEQREVQAFLNQYTEASSSADFSKLADCYLQEPRLVVFAESTEFRGWDSVKEYLLSRRRSTPMSTVLSQQPEIRVFGRLAWVTGSLDLSQQTPSPPTQPAASVTRRVTLILEKKRAAWFIVHEHDSFSASAYPANTTLSSP
ncbi:MAG: nuclear transport factor 2 family protein [Acidobacteriota bacterium]